MIRRGFVSLVSLGGALLVAYTGTASAQVILGVDGSIYPRGADYVVVGFRPCGSYPIDTADTKRLYPEVGSVLAAHALAMDVTVSLQLEPSTPQGNRSAYYLTSITPRTNAPHDARKFCTSSTPGGYYEGLLTEYGVGRNGSGTVDLRLSGGREVLLPFTRDAAPVRVGRQIPGETYVRAYVNNIVDPDGNTSQAVSRIVALPPRQAQ